MPSKYRIILEMASQTARDIASNADRYTDFLITAANNYKYSFKEQLLIHAQKPDATACAEIDTWNKLGRWVNKGTKGIALLIDRDVPYKLRHVFDISDTNSRAGRNITLWQMKPEYEYAVSESLQASFGDVEEPRDFPHLLMDISGYAVEDNLSDYLMELNAVKAGSFLEELDDTSLEAWLKTTLKSSVAFMALFRAGYEPRQYFDREDFSHLFDFNTVEVISVLGAAVSDISEMVIREMGETVKEMEKEEKRKIRTFAQEGTSAYHKNRTENKERSNEYGTDLYDAGGLSDSRSDRAGEPEAWEVWNAAADIPPRAPGWDLHRDAAERNTEQSSGGGGPASQRDDGTPDPTDGREAGRDGAPESGRSDEMGADDEFHSSLGGGSDSERPDLRVTLPTVEQQQEIIAEAEEEKSSAFSISQEDIDAILTRGSGIHQGKFRIYEQFLKQDSSENNIAFLKNEYGIGGAYPAVSGRNLDESHDAKGIKISRGRISRPDAELLLRWNKVEKRIGELIRTDRYLSQAEKDNYPAYQEQAEARKERGEISDEFRSIVYDYNDFVAQLGEESKALNLYYLSSCWGAFSVGEKKMHARIAEGDFILPMMREAMNAIIADNTHLTARCEAMLEVLNSDVAKPLEPTFDELNPPPEPQKEYRYHLGDTVYIGTQEYELLSFDEKKVVLFDTQFPLFNKELSREEFDNRLKENPLNDKLLQVVEEPPVADNTKENPDTQETEAIPDEELDALPISTIKDGEVVTYPNAEALLDDQEEALAPPLQVKRPSKIAPHVLHPEINTEYRTNFQIESDDIGVGTPLERFYHNIRAVQLLNKLDAESRLATPTEQRVLADYVGWGGLSEFFKEDNPHYAELKDVLSDEEYASARESTLTAFYTPPVVIKAVYSALENMHFQTGNVLEPSCGIGNFMGLVPESMNDAKFYGVELDSISGRIAQQLYQKNSIAVQGFESTNLPDSFFDAAIGNVPFGQFKVPDKRYDKHNFLIHDYFFARTLDKVRPGGVIAFITSKGTLDKENPNVRKYIAQRADLLGAIRLPNDTFKAAAGTEVTSDIIFLQKRDRLVDIEPDWVHLATDANGIRMNAYFVDNPEMVLGDMQMVSGPHGMESACIAYENAELGDLLQDAIQNIHAEITEFEIDDLEAEDEDLSIPADPDVRNFSFTVVDGKIYYRENSRMNPVDASATAESRIKGMIAIRDCVRTLIEYQTEDYPDADIKAEQEKLNRLYDEFSKKYGLISARANNSAFNSDSSYCLLASLEVLDDEGNFLRKADMFSKRTIKQKVTVQSVDTASEAYALSLAEKARIDMPYMSQLTGKTEQELFEDLKGVIFLNPMHISEEDGKPKYLPADEYLSGNVREKLRWAKQSAELYPEDYGENVRALEAVQPVDLTASEISVRLGATWLPPEIIEEFMFELFSTPRYCQWNIHVHYAQYTGEWNVEGKSYDRSNVKAHNTYGTGRVNGYKIMEETLNLRDVRIFDYIEDGNGRKTAVLNKKETAIAQGKQELIKQAFADWIWSDPERREQLTKLYNEKFNSIRPREYDGSHLNFVGINPEITLRPHQVNAIAHILYGGNTLLAHVVGAGKTFEMVAAAQESKRLGLCQKSLFVVPNHLTEQWASEYLQLYPSANILVATKKDFETKNRKKFCGRIATGDYDAVIIGHSQFEKIPMSLERQRAILQQQLDEVLDGISELKKNRGDNFSIKQLERTKKTVKQKLDKLNDQSRKDDVVTFEELGVDRIFIDEAHYYKNLAAFTKMRNVGGISQTEAMKSSDLYMKCRYLDELTGGRGVVFATGTPISNSMVEMYTMQKYLQYSALKRNDLLHFDAWASTFGETVTAIELSPEGYTLVRR